MDIIHCAAIQLRATGAGNLDLILYSLDEVRTRTLPSIVMSGTTSKLPVSITNFSTPRMQLEFSTDEIDEIFSISKIIFFIKPIFTSYPQ